MASDNFLQEKFDLAIKLVIAEKRDTTTDTYLRNRLTLLLYKLEHKEMLTTFETIVLLYLCAEMERAIFNDVIKPQGGGI